MPKQSSSSFIPRKRGAQTSSSETSRFLKGKENIFLVSAALVLLLVVTVWAGIELYQRYVEQQVAQKKEQFEASRQTLRNEGLDNIIRLSQRLDAADTVIERHIAPSIIFQRLEELTVAGLRYTSFEMEGDPLSGMVISLSGEAHNYATVIAQSNRFQRSVFIGSPTFRNIKENSKSGNITFEVSFEVAADQIRFSDAVGQAQQTLEEESRGRSSQNGATSTVQQGRNDSNENNTVTFGL